MVAEIFAGVSAFKTMLDTAKALTEMRDESTRLDASLNLRRQLSDAMEAYESLKSEKAALEAECVRLRDWTADKQRYELKEHGYNRILAYALKEGEQHGEPQHSLCPACFLQSKPSILQPESYSLGRAKALVCHACDWRGFTEGHASDASGRKR
jgi:hypothetical protein